MMIRHRQSKGQGLVELALVLPLLLLIIIAIFEFARIFLIYVNVSNAAREGSRYGMVAPSDYAGIRTHVLDMIQLVPTADVDILIRYDHGPGTGEFVNPNSVSAGDRIIVELRYLVQAITPLIEPFLPNGILIQPQNTRTIQNVRGSSGVPNPAPTFTSTPVTYTPTMTSTPRPLETIPATATRTSTPYYSPTPTPLPPIIIDDPVYAGETSVTGTAAPGQSLTLRIIQLGLVRAGSSDGTGSFSFTGLPALIAGHTIVVQGYTSQDLTIVQEIPTPTPTVPTGPYIYLEPICGATGPQTIIVHGRNIPRDNALQTLQFLWDGTQVGTQAYSWQLQQFDIAITVNVTAGTHTVTVNGLNGQGTLILGPLTASFASPCQTGPTATPTPSTLPDLVIANLTVIDPDPLGTYDTLHLVCSVSNISDVDATSLFWVDLYADPAYGVPLSEQSSVDYVAIAALEAGTAISFTMYVPDGFTTTSVHRIAAMVDTWDQISEQSEANNVSTTTLLTITVENTPPPPTPEVTPGPTGGIQGETLLNSLPQSYVTIYVYDSNERLWGSARSDVNGMYLIVDLPEGEYVVLGLLRLSDTIYRGQVGPVEVTGGTVTLGVDIDLVEVPVR